MKSLLTSRRGQVGDLPPTIIALIVAGVFLVLGIVILASIRDIDTITQANSASVSNETVTTVIEAGETLSGAASPGANSFAVSVVTNASSGEIIASDNYTISTSTGVISFSGSVTGFYNGSNWNVSYTFLHGDEAYTAGNETVVGLGTFGDFWDIIILAIITTLVIGLLLAVFGGRRQR